MFNWIKELVNPVKDILDEFKFSGEEKAAAKLAFAELEVGVANKILEMQMESLKLQAGIIQAESKGGWLQRNWRPLLMVTFMLILINNYILLPYGPALGDSIVPLEFPSGFWTLLTIGVGGYIASRGGEKMLDKIQQAGGIEFKNPGRG